jgi:hypothetical protein
MFRSRKPHRHESSRVDAATELYEQFLASDPPEFPSLEDVAMEAIVTGVCDRIDPRTSLGVALPTPASDEARIGLLTKAIALLNPVVERQVQHPGTLALSARCLHALYILGLGVSRLV